MEEIIIRLNPLPFVYFVLLLHKEVFPQIVGLCKFILLIVEIVVYRLVIAHLLVISCFRHFFFGGGKKLIA